MTSPKVPHKSKEMKHANTTGEVGVTRGSLFRKCQSRRFSIQQSTDDINKALQGEECYGPYAHIRETLDYTYHSHYRKERQWLQDSIIEDFMENLVKNGNDEMTTPEEPWFIYTVGAPGAGKRHTLMKLVEEGKLPLLSFVHVDPQEIRRRLPEFASYVLKCPDLVDELTSMEAGHIMEILVRVALEKGKNVVLDGSLHDADWYADFYQELRDEYPKMRMALLHITAPRSLILQRAAVSFMSVSSSSSRSVLACVKSLFVCLALSCWVLRGFSVNDRGFVLPVLGLS